MKKLYFVLFLLITQFIQAQQVTTVIGRWKLGLNVGATWQTADVSTDLFDLGYGATLEYAVYEKRSSFFGFSLRGRFLQGKTTGYDYLSANGISNNAINGVNDTNINYSFVPSYLNNKTSFNEFSLEAMLKWNSLYQNNGIVFYLYAGLGFTNYKVETDQLDGIGMMYDYSLITDNNGASTITELQNLQDGVFETELIHPDYNTLVFTPAVGIGLGFRIVPGLDFVWEHKISLPQTDLFDGQIYDSGDPSFIQDIYHYSSLGFIFSVAGHYNDEVYTPPVEPSEPVVPITPIAATAKPKITLLTPTTTAFNSPNCKIEITAKIENVKEQKDIDFFHNGNKVPSYKYFFSPTTFKSTVELIEGNNDFKITAKNGNLSDSKTFSLKCTNATTFDICHKRLDGTFGTLNIKTSEWNAHKAHGDTKGACPEKQLTICHNISGQPGKTETINISESQWNVHKSHGDYEGACQAKTMISICHDNQVISINEKDWASHAAHGDTKGPCPQVNMITICHVPDQGDKRVTMQIPETEWIVHQAHGDLKGSCPNTEPTTTICHKNNDGSKITMSIPEFRWNEHFAHGDTKGACPQTSFIICHKDPTTGKKTNISIYESGWAAHAAHGDTKGACPVEEKQLTICHVVPGKIGVTQTITIPESQWSIHKSHGDQIGACIEQEKMIQICHKSGTTKTTISIKESEWPSHAAHGDVKGTCPIETRKITICHTSGNIKKTIEIDPSLWPAHASHGDTKGACPIEEKKITICHYPPGNKDNPQQLEIPESAWPAHQAHGDSKGNCPEKQITICHTNGNTKSTITINESQWSIHAAHGDTKGACQVEEKKITICHYPPGNKDNPQQIEIPESAWPAHQAHGDSKGNCPEKQITICHKSGNTKTTITINESQWNAHFAHGDSKGACPVEEKKIKICHYPPGNKDNPQQLEIPESAWPAHQAHGDSKGICPEKQITICHNLPGKPGQTQTITIPESQWNIHKSHGDKKGECTTTAPTKITICHYPPGNNSNPQQIEIPESAWPAHQAHGDTKGSCPKDGNPNDPSGSGGSKKMKICHYPPGNNSNPQQIEISESAWPAHQAHGDSQGDCPTNQNGSGGSGSNNGGNGSGSNKKITICHYPPGNTNNPQQIEISESAWPAHQAHGDSKGACPTNQNGSGGSGSNNGGNGNSKKMKICHNVSPGVTETIEINVADWNTHKAHGDSSKPCTGNNKKSTTEGNNKNETSTKGEKQP